ncbi:IS256 family transposase [Ponticoccus gilvus]|nr:IS256 family transposase [Enemella evansiae]
MAHTELNLRERRAIEDMLNAEVPVSKIAAEIGRHRSSIYREIKRNGFEDEELPELNGYYGIISRAVIIAVAVNEDGKREVLGVATGPSEAETFWTEFLRSRADRGLRGVKLVIADDHKGLRAAARRVFNATHQRCRIHWMRNALAHAPTKQRAAVAAMVKTIFAQETKAEPEAQWEIVANAPREKQPKLGALMDSSRDDVLAYMPFPREHWTQIASTTPLERVNREVKRRADVIGIFPNDEAIIRLVGALMLETNDEWAVARRYMSLETLARVTDNPTIRLSAVTA